ncbi:anaerobic nitric oxide reductase flavorubredoxin [Clostridium algidicarnis]|uniref:Flavorubredoxin n=2 Tax=Clostridium algidicarnis TaxID=37659 RepID=A0A2S6G0J4_9CLOT|nr:anaerobic nitric oxide reductase flavorubredoxin [Clostridium algidicarnis]MBB6630363.1 anaerobic nitric oxide reductase flavorubredoxin [Clostridium algidicarnis]MBB6696497.1 anaerobic nitric oxide reductase flavorubredoxin [Clostridium algidicarnis]MBU3194054.1 anaerobic nitric oxide reductase flavorubredoxin [Clostridium algidicarnis]MBU3202873.1 anaerobic nitric oxide reductase flavorubredoxin [Clostridium algidicarnis]MBU3211027.1 anaerobic nitric oxide reductase flavorubredoxin [Clost
MSFKITNNVTWVGKIDWELRNFHGDEYSTHRGSSYNSYLIKGKKNVLIDTVWEPFAKEFIENLKKEINLEDIDYIIANHGEVDHSGALPLLLKEIPNVPVYCTANGAKILKAHYHEDWNFVEVKTGDSLDIGDEKLTFVEARMLHWPDSMMTYMSGDNILFSNDAFGQHYASDLMYNDLVDQSELYQEAIKYYANILTPFSPILTKKIEEILSFNLTVNMIAPSHGIIWRDNPSQIIEKYMDWAKGYSENEIVIVYDTMWNATRKMAEAIADGIKSVDKDVTVKLFNAAHSDKNDIITEMFKSKAILVGSSTVNKSIMSATGGILDMIKGLGLKNKKAAAFGSYGWSGESVSLLNERLKGAKLELVNDGIKELWNPDVEGLKRCKEFGVDFSKKL